MLQPANEQRKRCMPMLPTVSQAAKQQRAWMYKFEPLKWRAVVTAYPTSVLKPRCTKQRYLPLGCHHLTFIAHLVIEVALLCPVSVSWQQQKQDMNS